MIVKLKSKGRFQHGDRIEGKHLFVLPLRYINIMSEDMIISLEEVKIMREFQ